MRSLAEWVLVEMRKGRRSHLGALQCLEVQERKRNGQRRQLEPVKWGGSRVHVASQKPGGSVSETERVTDWLRSCWKVR